jgi:hypothetical protein
MNEAEDRSASYSIHLGALAWLAGPRSLGAADSTEKQNYSV